MAGTIIVFAGEYDLSCKERVRNFLEGFIEPNLALDLSDVSYVDSSFVNELVRLHHRRREKNFDREVIFLGSSMVQRLFEVLDLGSLFQIVGTLDAALANSGNALTIEFAFRGGVESAAELLQYNEAKGPA